MRSTLKAVIEPVHDILNGRPHPLDAFFKPRTVAVIGASESQSTVGRSVIWNLISNPFGGTIFPVNPKRPNILGIKCYPSIGSIPEQVDLAVIAIPAAAVPAVVGECVDAGVKAAIIISAGFKEVGEQGAKLEEEILERARRGRMRVIGPNCLGLMSPLTGLNATFAAAMARPGSVGFISQSGALCTAVLDWSLQENVGFSAFISIGSMADVSWGDLIDYLGNDSQTRSIILYMESIGDPRAFISAARQVTLSKPIIVIKAGRTEAAAKAAASHTGSLTGRDEVLDAAFRRCGVLRVGTIAELFYLAEVLSKQPRPKGPRLTIVSNAGGPGVLATDSLISEGGELAELSKETYEALNQLLPPQWSHNNPVDVLGDASPERYCKAVEIVASDPNSDGVLVIFTPQAMSDPTLTAQQLKDYAKIDRKPILASWMGGAQVSAGDAILSRHNIPTFPYPDTAARVFHSMWRYTYNLRGLYETPALVSGGETAKGVETAAKLVEAAQKADRTILTEHETKELLKAYGIPVVETRLAKSEDDAAKVAGEIGFPVVLKLFSETITHKTDVGGVRLHLKDEGAVRSAFRGIESSVAQKAGRQHFQGVTVQSMVTRSGYELIVGSVVDPQFGPVLLFGLGGQLVEVFKDHALALPPLNTTLARRLMEQTRVYKALKGVRGRKAVNLEEIEELLVRFSQLVVENHSIKEIEINPLLASEDGILTLDARAVLYPKDTGEDQAPKLAIRPYPSRYAASWAAKDGLQLTIRPIRPEDEPLMVKFHKALSESTVYMRYFHMLSLGFRVSHERLTRICFIDYDREMALLAVQGGGKAGEESIIGVGRMTKVHGLNEAEVAVVVADSFHRRGIGAELLRRLLQVGRDERLKRIVADILPENYAMQRVCQKLGFSVDPSPDGSRFAATIDLS